MWQTIKKVYVWTNQVRPPETKLMSLSDIDEQAEFEGQPVIPSASLVTVTWSNPVQYGYSSPVRYWGWQTRTDLILPTKWEMFLDCVFGWHNRNSESFLILSTDIWWIGLHQWTLTVNTSTPDFIYPWGNVNPTPVDFMDGGRHTLKVTWNGWTYNARIDSTKILNNASWDAPTSTTKFRFQIFWGSAYWIVRKSIYDFYVKDLS